MDLPPLDLSLSAQIGLSRCLALNILPLARQGEAVVVLCIEPPSPEARQRAKSAFGSLLWHSVSRAEFDAQAAPLLAAHCRNAEISLPYTASSRSLKDANGLRVAIALLALAIVFWPLAMMNIGLVLGAVCLGGNGCLKLFAALATRYDPPRLNPPPDDLPVISLLLPLFREEAIAAQLLPHLEAIDYPQDRLDICFLVEAEDEATWACLTQIALPAHMRILSIPRGTLRTKPRAMTYALPFLKGSLIGIYDAEDVVPPQLRTIAATFLRAGPRTACVQGLLDYHNPAATWLTRCFSLEYASWFRVLLKGLDRLNLIVPLGGTSLFLRRNILESLGGWDAYNVTEDADLGLRIARAGYRTEVINITTYEEATGHLWPWIKQRSRWLKGFAQTWAVHMRTPLTLWRQVGTLRFVAFQLMFLGTLLQTALAPLLWSLWLIPLGVDHPALTAMPRPLLITVAVVFALGEGLQWITYLAGAQRSGRMWLLAWVPAMHLYFPLASLALLKAILELLVRPFYWDKTSHGHFKP